VPAPRTTRVIARKLRGEDRRPGRGVAPPLGREGQVEAHPAEPSDLDRPTGLLVVLVLDLAEGIDRVPADARRLPVREEVGDDDALVARRAWHTIPAADGDLRARVGGQVADDVREAGRSAVRDLVVPVEHPALHLARPGRWERREERQVRGEDRGELHHVMRMIFGVRGPLAELHDATLMRRPSRWSSSRTYE
jgi:hypothetical protein